MMLSIWLGESTNPLNLLRQYFEANHNKKKATQMGMAFIIVFLILRVGFTPFIIGWMINLNPNINIVLKFVSSLMWWVSLVWAWKIVNMGLKVLSQVALVYTDTTRQQIIAKGIQKN